MALPATDTFTGADGTALTTYSSNWTYNRGSFALLTNGVRGTNGGDDAIANWNADTPNDDQYAKLTLKAIPTANVYVGAAVRCQAGTDDTAYIAYIGSTSGEARRRVYKWVAGTQTSLHGSSYSIAANDVVRIQAQGTTISASINGGADFYSGTDSAISSGRVGLSAFGNSTTIYGDDWEGGNIGGAQTIAVGQVTESGTPLAAAAGKTAAVGQVTESGALLGLSAQKTVQAGLVSESGAPLAATAGKSAGVGLVSETGAVLTLQTTTKTVLVGLVSEIGSPLALVAAANGHGLRLSDRRNRLVGV